MIFGLFFDIVFFAIVVLLALLVFKKGKSTGLPWVDEAYGIKESPNRMSTNKLNRLLENVSRDSMKEKYQQQGQKTTPVNIEQIKKDPLQKVIYELEQRKHQKK